jgi:hypothetical protein
MHCKNVVVFDDREKIISHLACRGFMKDYIILTKHGVGSSSPYTIGNPTNIDDKFQFIHKKQQPLPQSEHVVPNVTDHGYTGGNECDRTHVLPNVMVEDHAELVEEILHHHIDPSMFFMRAMECIMKAAKEPLYYKSKGCTKDFTTLRSVLKLLMLKARYGLYDASFNAFLSIIIDMLPKENKVPAYTYYVKKIISLLTMRVEKIHTCRNHYLLYRGDDYKYLESCPKCSASRYKTNKDYREEECVASVSKGKKRKIAQKRLQNP